MWTYLEARGELERRLAALAERKPLLKKLAKNHSSFIDFYESLPVCSIKKEMDIECGIERWERTPIFKAWISSED